MSRLRLHPYRLPLKRPWVAAAATLVERCGWLVEIEDDEGVAGWGDCAPLPSSGAAGHERARAALAALARRPAATDLPPAPPEVRWAVETALKDIEARRRGLPLARLLGAGELTVPVNAALGPLDAGCADRAAAAVAQGFGIGKIKVGLAPVAMELPRLREVAAVGGLRLRLDANRAWCAADARRLLTAIADLPIDGVEEPLADPTCAALAELQAALPFALAADESLPALGIEALLAARAVRRLVIKPARVGGIAATLALAAAAGRAGVDVVLTSVVDSTVGVAACAHLAAALGGPAHGLATGSWLAADVAPALPIAAGRLRLPDTPGLGVIPDPGRLAALI